MKVGIIIVTYNSQKDIGRLLKSIIIQKNNNIMVYIVDNYSTDNTLEIINEFQSDLPVNIISCKTNNGFAKGNNIGIKKAMDDGCELVFILNPDIKLEYNCIDNLTNKISSDESVGVVGPVVLYGNKPGNIIQGYGVTVNFKTQNKKDLFGNENLVQDLPSELMVDFVLGGAMMVKSKVLKVTGLFEEDYFMYNDELDLAYRIKKAGYKTICVRDAIVRHFHDFNATNKKGNNLMYYYMMRNKYLYFKKHRLHYNLFLSLMSEFIKLPLTIKWAIRRMKNIRLIKYYYSGIFNGLIGKSGISSKSFD